MDDIINNLKDKLKEKGYKLTTQRRIILDVLVENQDSHLSPEEIYEEVKQKYPEIGLATVYRTLQLFEELGVIYKLNFNDGCSRYELNAHDGNHQHHHLICLECGKVIEVDVDLLESLEEEIANSCEFKVVDHNVKLFGYCKDCQEKTQKTKNENSKFELNKI